MNAAEHKAQAERFLDKVARGDTMNSDRALATAQVHATLATIPDEYVDEFGL